MIVNPVGVGVGSAPTISSFLKGGRMPENFHMLPRLRDSLSYLYVEHAVIERRQSALLVLQELGNTLVPIANLCVLLLGPGTTITHAAMGLLAANGVSVVWCGEDGTHYYAQGNGETHRANRLIHQAKMYADAAKRQEVVLRMYRKRFGEVLDASLTIEQIRGMEGVRVRTAYADASREWGVAWKGRMYDRKNWHAADTVNRALSAANAVLHGLCHAAIVSGGYSPGLGFLHTGWHLAFMYDIADLYKTKITVPVAFEVAAASEEKVESRARKTCRERLYDMKLLNQILPDIEELLAVEETEEGPMTEDGIPIQVWWETYTNEVQHGDYGP
jgi:CRISP-associated protein Cas1